MAQTDNRNPLWIGYYRISTNKQKGLGLDAQRARVRQAAMEANATIIAEVWETESGTETERPKLNKVLGLARKNNAVVVVAKADRLSRDLTYASYLVFKSGIKFNCLNMTPEAMENYIIFGVMFGMAAQEARFISQRTKEALAVLKAKGVELGRPNAKESITREMVEAATEQRIRKANENHNNIKAANEIRQYLSKGGNNTLLAIASHLNNNGYLTSRGVLHTATSVKLLCNRFGINR